MSRPKNKQELLNQATINFENLFDFIESIPEKEQDREFSVGTMNRNIRDVLCHLHHWHLLMMEWYTEGMKGNNPIKPARGYTWKTTPELNKWIFKNYQETSLEQAKYLVKKGYSNLRKIVESHSNEELFTKKKYRWTGSTSLGSYLTSATTSHYNWAFLLIKKNLKK